MPVYKFTWDQEFGWDDWRTQEWTTRAKSKRAAWLEFYDTYGVIDGYIEWKEEWADEDIKINKDKLMKTIELEVLEHHANHMVANEWLQTDITGAKIQKI